MIDADALRTICAEIKAADMRCSDAIREAAHDFGLDDAGQIEATQSEGRHEYSAEDPCDVGCGSPCTPDGCRENHSAGNVILSGPYFDNTGESGRLMFEAECEYIVAAANHAPALADAVIALLDERADLTTRLRDALRAVSLTNEMNSHIAFCDECDMEEECSERDEIAESLGEIAGRVIADPRNAALLNEGES